MKRISLLFTAVLLLGGCGYHLPERGNTLPPEVRTVYVELFTNRTYEPYLENYVTEAIVDWFAGKPELSLTEDRSRADAVLSGTVTTYTTKPISYDRNDVITEYRSAMTIAATLRQSPSDRVLWKGSVDWSEEYPTSLDKGVQEDNETAAIAVISERIARELFYRVMDNF